MSVGKVKVYFLDASSKTFIMDSNETFDGLICQAISKFGIEEPEKMMRFVGSELQKALG